MENLINIKITVRSAHSAQDQRNRHLREFLTAQGYEIEQAKTGHDHEGENSPVWQAFSHEGEGEDIKKLLRHQGFADNDFQILVEYQRAWGFL